MQAFKNIFRGFLVLLMMVLFSCETEQIIFKGPYFVRFSENTQTLRESYSKVIRIPVHMAGPVLEEDLIVRYSVDGDAREGVDYIILGDRESVIIRKGERFGYIEIQLINNANNIIRSQEIVIRLLSTDNSAILVGQDQGDIGKTFTFTIFDDCILGGNYKGARSAFSIPVEGITITSEDCETYTLSNWNIDIFNTPFDIDLTFIDNGDNTLTIPEQEEDILPSELATIRGSGTVDPITRVIKMTVVLADFEGQPEITFTLTPD